MPGPRGPAEPFPWIQLHARVLAGDHDAAESLTALVLPVVEANLGWRFRHVDATILHDAAVDALLAYLGEPARYDPSRAKLSTYLTFNAARKVADRLRSDRRRGRNESAFAKTRSPTCEPAFGTRPIRAHVILQRLIRAASTDARERRFLAAWCAGERSAPRLSTYLGMNGADPASQARAVRRAAGRLIPRLRHIVKGAG